jgi:hypothetical protein
MLRQHLQNLRGEATSLLMRTIISGEIGRRDEARAFPGEDEHEPAGACSNPANPAAASDR